MLQEKTIQGLRRAFGVPEGLIISKAAEAMGVPVDRLYQQQAAEVSNRELLAMLAERLGEEGRP